MNKKRNIFVQASILVIAGVLVRIIGLLYRAPLTQIIGDEGNGYYSQAYNIYTIILLISSYSIPLAISKVISAKLAFKEYKNAHRAFLCALIYVSIVGAIASLFLFFGAPFLVDHDAVPVLRIFAPTVFFYGILGVLRGYFQAHGSMVQTSLSQIIEQLLNAVISISAAYFFTQMCIQQGNAAMVPIYGASGSALGTGAGVIIGLIFMLSMYWLNHSFFKKRISRDSHEEVASYKSLFKTLLLMVTPVIFSTFIYNCSTTLDMKLYYYIAYEVKGLNTALVNSQYGIFSTKFIVLMNIPVALASSISNAIIPEVSSSFAINNIEKTNSHIQHAIRFTMFLCIPSAVGMSVLAYPIVSLLFPQPNSLILASSLLRYGAICILFYSLSTVTNSILQGIGKVNIPVRNAILALIGHFCILFPILYFTDWDLYALLIGMGSYSFFMCLLNGISVKKYTAFQQDIKKSFLLPALSACIMGAVVYVIYYTIYILLPSNALALLFSIPLGALVYFVSLLKVGGVTESDLQSFPKGTFFIRIAKKIHLL
ncbi:MAG: oligosaccharide flippase family protein [Velocimicrobium sp.]